MLFHKNCLVIRRAIRLSTMTVCLIAFFVPLLPVRAAAVRQEVVDFWNREYAKNEYIASQGGTFNQTHVPGDGRYYKSRMKGAYGGQTVTLDKVVRPEQVFDDHALVQESDKNAVDVVVRRTEALLNHLKTMPGTPDLSALEAEFNAAGESASGKDGYLKVCAVRRKIALSNPLLDFDKLLFVEFNPLAPRLHMCSQYYGHNHNNNEGRIYVLDDALGVQPQRRDLLADAVVENGTYQGRKLEGGIFLSPELSYDGNTVYFAWCAKDGGGDYDPGQSYHIFRVNSDGTGLRQLTDGAFNDFDPHPLPNGRLVFMSTRRGDPFYASLRCGGMEPAYTLHTMKTDGSDIYPLSYHETHEWHPSVDNNGMIVYTRWDYVDRSSNHAHHIWYCYPDGRDPRAPHGNYSHPYVFPHLGFPEKVGYEPPMIDGLAYGGLNGSKGGSPLRPWMEMSIRAIPGSHKYVSTAAGHHGVAWGSLVLIDPTIEDDGMMSQVKRYTPNCLFPEGENFFGDEKREDLWGREVPDGLMNRWPIYYRTGAYATAWPFSEDFMLCNYWKNVILLDRFGNKILLYSTTWDAQDDEVVGYRPIDPVPLQARPIPPVLADKTNEGVGRDPTGPKAVISVQNIYEMSPFDWPEGVKEQKKIKWMRIVQLIPWTSHMGGVVGEVRYSTPRMSLGIVPVEEDGSVYCEAPIHKPIYFQALDENRMAIQGMKSVTYVHSGEHLSCVGCHEDKWKAIPPLTSTPQALTRKPSPLGEEFPGHHSDPTKGAIPFNYHLLARPALRKMGYSGDYKDMVKKAWYNDLQSFSAPGHIGAHESQLGKEALEKYHQGVMSEEDFRRVVMWIDLCSMELPWEHDVDVARAGSVVWPEVDIDRNNPLGVEQGQPVPVRESVIRDMDQGGYSAHGRPGSMGEGISLTVNASGITVKNPSRRNVTVTVHDIKGRTFANRIHRGTPSSLVLSRDIVPRGMCVVRVRSGNVEMTQAVTILR